MIALLLSQSALCACIALALMLRDVGREIDGVEAVERARVREEDEARRQNRLRNIFYLGWQSARMGCEVRSSGFAAASRRWERRKTQTVRCFGGDVRRCDRDLADGGNPVLTAPLEFKEACERHSALPSPTSSPVAVVGLAVAAAWLLGMFFGLSEVVAAILMLACWGVSTSLIRCAVEPSDAP